MNSLTRALSFPPLGGLLFALLTVLPTTALASPNVLPAGKTKGTAVALSFLPGVGQHYLGYHTKGLAMNGLFLSGLVMANVGWSDTYESGYDVSYGSSGWEYYDYANDGGGAEINAVGVMGYAFMFGSVAWSLIDAGTTRAPSGASGATPDESSERGTPSWDLAVASAGGGMALGVARRF